MNVLEKCRDQLLDQLRLVYPDKDPEVLKEFVEKEIKSSVQDRQVLFNDGERKTPRSLLEFSNWMEEESPILTGYGAVYKKHDDVDGKNLLANMFDYLLKSRKIVKKEMFKHVNDLDKTEYNRLDLEQKTYKLLANSGYGATVEKNCIFYNSNFGPSITYNGVIIITTAVNAFESFMSNNLDFDNLNDVLMFINRASTEVYKNTDIVDKHISKEELYDYLSDKFVNKNQFDLYALKKTIDGLSQEEMDKVYYKNNLYKFFENTKIEELLLKVIGNKDFLDPNEPPEDIAEYMQMIWNYLDEWVLYKHLNFYRFRNADKGKRKTVLVVDTDSNFLMLDPFYKYFYNKYEGKLDKSDESRVATVNIATFFLSNVIREVYEKMTREMNVPEAKRPIINMKNEFFYKRLMTTRNKKSYAGLLIMQEGNMYDNPEIDVKGLAIRKVSVNSKVRKYFTELLEDRILSSDNIDLGTIYGSFLSLQNEISDSLKNGEIEYLLPGKANEIESYATPYQMQPVRGAIAWNALYPHNEIVLPAKVNLLKLKIESLEDIAHKIPMEEYEILKSNIFDHPELGKYGFKVLAFPKSAKTIPEWLIPYIDVETMVNDHVKSGIIMLESLGFKTLDILNSQFPTNVLNF